MAFSALANTDRQLESIAAHINSMQSGSDFAISGSQLLNSEIAITQQTDTPLTGAIIGGTDASRGEYEEYVLLIATDTTTGDILFLCGGTLISANTVLTSAQCSQNSAASYFTLPGFYSFEDDVEPGDFVQVSRIDIHPNYDPVTVDFDIAVMTLSEPSKISPAPVYQGTTDLVDTEGTVIGTGLTVSIPDQEVFPNNLQEVAAPITTNEACNDALNQIAGVRPVTENMLCAGFSTDARGACSGDIGGPLFADFNGVRTIVGTVSIFFRPCELNRATSVYARTSALSDFIESVSPNTGFVRTSDAGFIPSMMMLLTGESIFVPPRPTPLSPSQLRPPIEVFSQGQYVIRFVSEPGDPVGRGQEYIYTPQNSNISITTDGNANTIDIEIEANAQSNSGLPEQVTWEWNMFAPGTAILRSGYFQPDSVSVEVTQRDGFCFRPSTNSLRIRNVVFSGRTVTRLVADFIQDCDSNSEELIGSIYYDASMPDIQPFYPRPNGQQPSPQVAEPEFAGANIEIEVDDGSGPVRTFSITPEDYIQSFELFGSEIELQAENEQDQWRFAFRQPQLDAAPENGERLEVGAYPIVRTDDRSNPLQAIIKFTSNPRVCFDSSGGGQLRVFDISYPNGSATPDRMVADLEISCLGGAGIPPAVIKASINYNANLPQNVVRPDPPPPLPVDFPTLTSSGSIVVFTGTDGQTRTFTDLNSEIITTNLNAIDQSIIPDLGGSFVLYDNSNLSISFLKGRQISGDRLVEGVYSNVDNFSDFFPSMELSHIIDNNSDECINSDESFIIYEVAYEPDGVLSKLFAQFEANCSNLPGVFREGFIAFDSLL